MTAATARGNDTTTLVRFVLARADEDDALLRRAVRQGALAESEVAERSRQYESRRRIAACAQQLIAFRDLPNEHAVRAEARQILKALAYVHRDHRQFQSDWLR